MPQIVWSQPGTHRFETGVDRGVLYLADEAVPWDGLRVVDEKPTGGELEPLYYDGQIYANVPKNEFHAGTIKAFTSPEAFDACEGLGKAARGAYATGQRKKEFGLCYRTQIGSDLEPDLGYKLHFIYQATVAPTSKSYSSISDKSDPMDLTWDFVTRPLPVPLGRPTGHFVVDSTLVEPGALEALETIIYGDAASEPRLPSPSEIVDILNTFAALVVTDNGDGTATITGPDQAITWLTSDSAQINWETVVQINPTTYRISSL